MLTLSLKASPPQRLDLSPLLPHLLAGKTAAEISAIDISTTREKITVGEVFSVRAGSTDEIRFEGGSERFDGDRPRLARSARFSSRAMSAWTPAASCRAAK